MASDILRRARLVRREIFDPTNPEHIESFKVFLRTSSWGDIQFYPEDPYTEAPATVMFKYAAHILGITAETAEERAVRLAANPRLITVTPASVDKVDRLAEANRLMATLLGLDRPATA